MDTWKVAFSMPNWHAKKYGGYDRTSQEAKDNADMMRAFLNARGWTDNAIAGILGNISAESGYNPWRWQSDDVLNSTDTETIRDSTVNAYGLFQFTPAGKYILSSTAQSFTGYAPNFNDVAGNPLDAEAQLAYIDAGLGGYYPTATYDLTLAQFKASMLPAETLASAWLYNYERPADPSATESVRRENARYWHEYFGGHPTPGRSLPVWMIYQIKKRRLIL